MAEQQNDVLIERTGSEETVLNVGIPRRQSDARAFKIAGITMLACLFVAGQALTAYFVISQKSQITTLETSTSNLRRQLTESSRGRDLAPKMVHMPVYNMPLLMDMSDDNKKIPMKKLQDTVMVSVEKQVKDLLKDQPLPNFNETFLTNLQSLKEQVNESEWKGLETWMRYWLVFQMAQQKPPASSPGPEPTPRGESSLQTKCQLEAGGMGSVKPGFFRPQCDQLGNYLPMQCWHSTGYCWCVDKDGVEIPNTLVRGRPVCGGGPMAARMVAFPAMAKMETIKDEEN